MIIGSGFAGLSAACFMSKAGWEVAVIEKNLQPGGRARRLSAKGFHFDMGPSWYWMPDVFEHFFACFGKTVAEMYSLKRLDPSYRIYFDEGFVDIPADYELVKSWFESVEAGAGKQLDKYLKEAAFKYLTGMQKMVYKPGHSILEFADWEVVKNVFRMDIFSSVSTHISEHFKHPHLRQILSFPILFLGALPQNTPALYSLMNYADIMLGTWYPKGGMFSIVESMEKLAREQGVVFHYGVAAKEIISDNKTVKRVLTEDGKIHEADVVIGGADYHHVEHDLLKKSSRGYSENYWSGRKMAPSCLLYYIGINRKISGLRHHTLFFDTKFDAHAADIYSNPAWPTDPLFYLSTVSVTDPGQAPEGCENLFILIPVSAGIKGDSDEVRESYFNKIASRLVTHTGIDIRNHILYKKTFGPSDFEKEYHAYKGNAYGLANTLGQTAFLKPVCRSRKLKNLFFTGQLTVPGPGVPPALISGEIVAGEVLRYYG